MSKSVKDNSSKLRSFRHVNGLTLKELAALTNSSVTSLHHYENGTREIPSSIISILNRAYKVGLVDSSKKKSVSKKVSKSVSKSVSSKSKSFVVTVKTTKTGKNVIGKSRELGRKLQAFRRANNISAYKLSTMVGKAEQTIWNYESGSNPIPVEVVNTLNSYGFGAKLSSDTTSSSSKTSTKSNKEVSFGSVLKSFRNSLGLNLKQFGAKYHMSSSHVYNLETGKAWYLSLDTLREFKNEGIDIYSMI